MCRTPHFAIYKRIAASPEAPQDVRDAAQQQLGQASFQALVNKADTHTGIPPSGSTEFACTIYSMNNKDFAEHAMEAHPRTPITNWDAIMNLPGILFQDTKGFRPKTRMEATSTIPLLTKPSTGFRPYTISTKRASGGIRSMVRASSYAARSTFHEATTMHSGTRARRQCSLETAAASTGEDGSYQIRKSEGPPI
jgi:hypothetical protein